MYYYIEQFRASDNFVTGREEVSRLALKPQTRERIQQAVAVKSPVGYKTRQIQSKEPLPCFPHLILTMATEPAEKP